MKKKDNWDEPEVKSENKPTAEEYETLRAGIASFELKRINGRLHAGFEQYCQSKDVISFNEYGDVQVINPYLYTRWNRMRVNMEKRDNELQEAYFQANPEARQEEKARIAKHMQDLRDHLKSVNKGKKLAEVE